MAQKEIAVYGSNTLSKQNSLPKESFWDALRTNPIIRKELRQRMRSWQGLVDMIVCTLILIFVGLAQYSSNFYTYRVSYTFNGYGSSYANQRTQETGTQFFLIIVIIQLLLLFLFNCKYSAGTVVREKERQTYDVLLVSLLQPHDIVSGHLVAGLSYLLLCTVAGWPVAFLAFLMGGISTELLIVSLVVIPLNVIMLAAIGIFWSCAARTARKAAWYTLINSAVLQFGLPFIVIFFTRGGVASFLLTPVQAMSWSSELTAWLFSFNPIYVLMTCNEIFNGRLDSNLLLYSTGNGYSLTPFVRFIIISLVVSIVYYRLALRQVKPLQNKTEKQQAIRAIKQRLNRNIQQ